MKDANGSIQLNPTSIEEAMDWERDSYEWIRFDPSLHCNLRCIYCHNPRTDDLMNPATLGRFLEEKVASVENVQIGCAMEPTLDDRLGEFIATVGSSKTKPRNFFQLQTNGTLLHRHDVEVMREAGLNQLSVSIDTINPETFKFLRGGANIDKVIRNLTRFHEQLPEVEIQFICTVTRRNIDDLDELVRFGLDIGTRIFVFREMFHLRFDATVDHDEMRKLELRRGEFKRAKQDILAKYGDRAVMHFHPVEELRGLIFGTRGLKSFLLRKFA